MPGPAKVCAITVNWMRCDDTLECIASLYQGGVPDLDIIVIDNGSNDGSVERIRRAFPHVTIKSNQTNEGYAKAANQGIRMALERGADYILTINNDAVGRGEFIKEMILAFQRHDDCGVMGCKIYYYDTDNIWYAGGYFNEWLGVSRHPGMDQRDDGAKLESHTDFVTGCVMLTKAEVFRKVGLFDEMIMIYSEDLDFCLRAHRYGYGSWYVPTAVVFHKVSMTTGQGGSNYMTQYRCYYYARNSLLVMAKNQSGLKLVTSFAGQVFILLPYYFMLISMQRSTGGFKKYVGGLLKGMKMLVEKHE
jgi:GT2 family glycosyltransferase